jgi:hypothetical protein
MDTMTAEMLELLVFEPLLVLGQPHLHHHFESRNRQGRTTWIVLDVEEEARTKVKIVEFTHKATLGKSKPFKFLVDFRGESLEKFQPRSSQKLQGQRPAASH